jgi:fatty acid synthase subunit alpha
LAETFNVERVKEMLGDIVKSCFEKAQEQQKAEGYIKLERGFATIPLPGIDVPFHSRYLWAGVLPFRACMLTFSHDEFPFELIFFPSDLSKKINPCHLNPDMLVGKYIPNLIAKPFDVSREYAQIIYDQTSSPKLDKVLKKWEQEKWASAENRQKLAYIILVELLAYQFASPVRWIQTQDLLFTTFKFERLVELGPSPTLTGMATRTLKTKYETLDGSVSRNRSILCHAKNVKEIYYQYEDEIEVLASDETVDVPIAATPAAPVTTTTAVSTPSSGPVASMEDVPIKAIDILLVIVAQKLKKRVDEIPLSKSIKDLVGGKSTLQNEILGDLQQEFASAPEKGEELPLEELGSALGSGFSGALGKYSTGLISRLIGGKMPGGFNSSAIKSYLSKSWGLGSSRSDGVLLLGTTLEPPKRLASEAEGKSWLDGVVSAYAQRSGISLASPGAGGASGGGGGGAVINSEEFLKFQSDQQKFAAQHVELYMRYLGRDSRAGEVAFDQEKATSLALQAKLDSINREHGDAYIEGIQPRFDILKARHFDSSWNWVRQDALLMYYDIIFGRLTTVDREITARCIALLNRADPDMLQFMQYNINQCDASKGETYRLAKGFGQKLIDNTREVIGKPPMYKDGALH